MAQRSARRQRELERTKLEEGMPIYTYKEPATLSAVDKGKQKAQEEVEDDPFGAPTTAPQLKYITTSFEADAYLSGMGSGPFGFE